MNSVIWININKINNISVSLDCHFMLGVPTAMYLPQVRQVIDKSPMRMTNQMEK